jgi:hypothetical protein
MWCYLFDVFRDQAEKEGFVSRLTGVRDLLLASLLSLFFPQEQLGEALVGAVTPLCSPMYY